MTNNNFQNYGGNPLLPISGGYQTERQRFQVALQQLDEAIFGKEPMNLVVWSSDSMLALIKYFEIGSREYPSSKERQKAILSGLNVGEFFLVNQILSEIERNGGIRDVAR
jgi:hypothetical protein